MEKYRPDIYQKSLLDVHFNKLKESGIKVLLIDMDNTILKYKEKEVDQALKQLLLALKTQFTVIVFSNATYPKVKRVSESLQLPFFAISMKPTTIGFKKVFKKYKVEPEEVAIIGDQIMTDIKGGNKAGVTTILIDPLMEQESVFTKANRKKEKKIMTKMGARGLFFKERYYE